MKREGGAQKIVSVVRTLEDFLFNRALAIFGEEATRARRFGALRGLVDRFYWAEAMRHTPKAALINYKALKWALPMMVIAAIVNIAADISGIFHGDFDILHAIMTVLLIMISAYSFVLKRKAFAVINSFSDGEEAI